MSHVQKPKYFMGLQHWEGQSPRAVFANVLAAPRGLEPVHMPAPSARAPTLKVLHSQKIAPTNPFLVTISPNPPQHTQIFFLTAVAICASLRLYCEMVMLFLPIQFLL